MPAMKRIAFLVAALIAAPATAQSFTGTDLYQLCQTNEPACGQYVRKVLKEEGWPERVPSEKHLKRDRSLVWRICPSTHPFDDLIAKQIRENWATVSATKKANARNAAIAAMSAAEPTCAASIQN